MLLLTKQQIHDLAIAVLKEFDSPLSGDELTSAILLLLEDVSGFELASEQEIHQVINQIRSAYDELIK